MLHCQYCNKECKNKNSLTNHEIRCKSNPNKIKIKTKASYGMTGKRHSDETKQLIGLKSKNRIVSDSTIQKLKEFNSQYWNDEARLLHSERMKKCVKQNPDSYSAGNQGRVKTYEIDGIKLKGTWELKFYNWCKLHEIEITRPNIGFAYEWNGIRTYFPDFYLPSYDLYIEVKGYETDRDKAKWSYFPHKLKIVKNSEIKLIENNEFDINFIIN